MPRFNESSAHLFKRSVDAGIESPLELASLMGNASVETYGFSTMHERLGYTSVENVVRATTSAANRFTRNEIQAAIDSRDPKEIGEILYEGRPELGNHVAGDGYKFHGRGYFQFTGRHNYTTFGNKFEVDLAGNPDLAATPEVAANLAVSFWKERVPVNHRADPVLAGQSINGGGNGEMERLAAFNLWKATITPELVSSVKDGSISLEQLVGIGVDERSERRRLASGDRQPGETMCKGDHGTGIAELQSKLEQLGYTSAAGQGLVNPGNHFGPVTHQAVRAFQRANDLVDDGVVGPSTHQSIDAKLRELEWTSDAVMQPTRLDDPLHPGNKLYQQAHALVCAIDREKGRTSDQLTDNLASAITVAACTEGMSRIDKLALSDDASQMWIGQGLMGKRDTGMRWTSIDTVQGLNTPMEYSAMQWLRATPAVVPREHFQQHAQQPLADHAALGQRQ